MEPERSHRRERRSYSSEFFICFTSRPSSSMKISSKSILSPGRTDKFHEQPTLSLSSSLSRRLRSNGSMKGGQSSPMFPTGNKKKGCAFETSEPSSPKVTCIGQVRVKSKKQGRKMRSRSKRRGEMSFRKTEQTHEGIHHHQPQQECLPYRNQKWVHLPLTICEALRAFGADFNCFLPCRSSCTSTSEREKEEKRTASPTGTNTSSCGAFFARWLMALQEGEDHKRDEEKTQKIAAINEIQIEAQKVASVKEDIEEEEEQSVSICIPPKNALLLMRCRSEPLRMSSLANRFWDSPAPKDECEEQDEYEEEQDNEEDENEDEHEDEEEAEEKQVVREKLNEEHREEEMSEKWVSVEVIVEDEENPRYEDSPDNEEDQKQAEEVGESPIQQQQQEKQDLEFTAEELVINGSLAEAPEEPDNQEKEEEEKLKLQEQEEEEEEEEGRRASCASLSSVSVQPAEAEDAELLEPYSETNIVEKTDKSKIEETVTEERETQEKSATDEEQQQQHQTPNEDQDQDQDQSKEETKSKERELEEREEKSSSSSSLSCSSASSVLPDCLLLMMCEPKLSMEVSKETWVSSTDFIKHRPDNHQQQQLVTTNNGGDESNKRISIDSNPAQQYQKQQQQQQLQQPHRTSFSNHAPTTTGLVPSLATMVEQKLENAKVHEPFVLTRCKSEPMRSSTRLMPEACFWKNRKLEPHRPGTRLGVGAAGIGF